MRIGCTQNYKHTQFYKIQIDFFKCTFFPSAFWLLPFSLLPLLCSILLFHPLPTVIYEDNAIDVIPSFLYAYLITLKTPHAHKHILFYKTRIILNIHFLLLFLLNNIPWKFIQYISNSIFIIAV